MIIIRNLPEKQSDFFLNNNASLSCFKIVYLKASVINKMYIIQMGHVFIIIKGKYRLFYNSADTAIYSQGADMIY